MVREILKDLVMYQIKIAYTTGNSFNTENREEIFDELEWENLDVAKENLKRIKEHYDWYCSLTHCHFWEKKEKPEWHNVNAEHTEGHNLINLITDDGKDFQFWPFWIGYFESLNYVEIVTKKDKSTKFYF